MRASAAALAGATTTKALILLSQGHLSAAALAGKLGVTISTAKRVVQALRRSGWDVVSARTGKRTHYHVRVSKSGEGITKDPLLSTTIHRRPSARAAGKPEDSDYDP